jgi:hypothetical protein
MRLHKIVFVGALALAPALSFARGPSPYLPLDLSPRIERQIERVLILAGKPVMRRPIAAATVLDALPVACERDYALCAEVRRYIDGYTARYGITHFRPELTLTSGDSVMALPNAHGDAVDSAWRVDARAHVHVNDFIIVNAGGIAYDGRAVPTGSFVSIGFDFAQLDIGYRDHWLGPLSDSAMAMSTQAPTMPSVSLSNYRPLTSLGFSYEVFAAEMSTQHDIAYGAGTTSGKPRLAGLQLAIEPVIGFALAANRITQYGGGARGGRSFSDFFDALTTNSNKQDANGVDASDVNRIASLSSNLLFPGKVPFGVRIEYAGEDNTFRGNRRLGQTDISLGLDFPLLWRDFAATYEVSEFQNGWYVHHIYPQGPRNEGNVLGHWFGDNRLPRDAIGGRSHMVRLGWHLPNGDYAQARYRTLDLDPRWGFDTAPRPYRRMQLLEINYATQLLGHPVDAQLEVGEDIFGESFVRLGAAFDFAASRSAGRAPHEDDRATSGTELFVDAGVQYSRAREFLFLDTVARETTDFETNYHFGFGARRPVSSRNDLGVRIELDRVAERSLVSLRLIDYRFRPNAKLALGAFAGVGRYDLTLDAHGYYFGAGVQYRDILPGWDVNVDVRRYDKLNRDKGLASDPESNPNLPRRFVDVQGVSLYLSKRW